MKTIGLIGGMSFESTAVYYRLINEAVQQRLGALHSAEILLHSLNFQPVVDLQKAGRWDAAGERLATIASRLQGAGADCVLICSNTMHLVADSVCSAVSIPVIDIIDETARSLKAEGKCKPLLLATRYTMEHGFYSDRMADHGIAVMVPDAHDRTNVHDIIFTELCEGIVLDSSRARLMAIIEAMAARGADSVILGCTEICLILDPADLPVAGFDSTSIHVGAAVDFALGAKR